MEALGEGNRREILKADVAVRGWLLDKMKVLGCRGLSLLARSWETILSLFY